MFRLSFYHRNNYFKILFLCTLFFHSNCIQLYSQLPGRFLFDTIKLKNWPAIHSFSFAEFNHYVFMFGGRTDGIHGKESGFENKNSNSIIYLWNTLNDSIISYKPDSLNDELLEFISASNACFTQDDHYLYVLGGYGQSKSGVYKTYPVFLKVNLQECISAILQNRNVANAFKYKVSDLFAVTGGQLKIMDSLFYLVGGQKFDGKYSSDDHTINQKYTDALRIFSISESQDTLSYTSIKEITNDAIFHRRDYNVNPIISTTGEIKLMVYGGVFQYNINRAFLNTALIQNQDYEELFDFEHKFASYNCARIGLYDSLKNEMYQVFFGGMAEFYRDSVNAISRDNYVPFVKSISSITRHTNGKFEEHLYPEELPGYFGTNAEFLINPELKRIYQDIVDYNSLKKDTSYLGCIFGGIYNPSAYRNVWQQDSAHLTRSNPYVLKVSFVKNQTTDNRQLQNSNYDVIIIPNPAKNQVVIKFKTELVLTSLKLSIQNTQGYTVKNLSYADVLNNELILSTDDLVPQKYILNLLINEEQLITKQLIVLR